MPFATNGTPNIKGLEDKIDKLHQTLNKKEWWEKTWVQAIALISAIVGLYAFFR